VSDAIAPAARGLTLRAAPLATVASLTGLVAVSAFAPESFAAHGTVVALAAIVVLGLPHGAMDIRAIRSGFRLGVRGTAAVLLLYLAAGGAAGAAWIVSPVAALLLFLAVATVHFAEDWQTPDAPVLALALPLAIFSAGAMRDRGAYDAIFIAMTGSDGAAAATSLLIVLGPLAHAAGLAAVLLMARSGDAWRAVAGAACVAAMWVLPPVAGFAVYFAFFHSPLHLREVAFSLTEARTGAVCEGIATFAAAIGLILLLSAAMETAHGFPAMGSAIFVALAILTVPHMVVPRVVAALVDARPPAPMPQGEG